MSRSLASSANSSLFSSGVSNNGVFTAGTSFADVLAAVSPSGTTSLAAAASELNAQGIPRSLAGYGNGKIPADALAPLNGSSERMWAPAAERLNAMISDAKAAGVSISVTDGYRTYDSQVRLAQQKGLYSQGGLAAAPGTSEHGWGLAVDLGLNPTAQAWMRQHAQDYGFVENVPREPWHWEFVPKA
nr:M15 family metallopeptidase [Demequina sp. TTPB684]